MLDRFRKMSTSTGSQSPLSQASQAHSESLPVSGSARTIDLLLLIMIVIYQL